MTRAKHKKWLKCDVLIGERQLPGGASVKTADNRACGPRASGPSLLQQA